MSTTALTTDGRFPVRRGRPNRPSVDNASRSSWCPHFGDRFILPQQSRHHPSGMTGSDDYKAGTALDDV